MTDDPIRWTFTLALLAMYTLGCMLALRRKRAAADGADWIVAWASQTGAAQELARQTVSTLQTAGLHASAVPLSELDEARLAGASRVLFIASTFGEGGPPDNAVRFERELMRREPDLGRLHYALLALGDSSYEPFCGFGRHLDSWLAERGAQAMFPRVEVDRGDAGAIAEWQEHLCHLSGASDAAGFTETPYSEWTIARREHLNPGSEGAPVYRIALVPASGAMPEWQAGDLAQVQAPADPGLPREYSIASLPSEGRLELLVRLRTRADGTFGSASGWLCREAADGASVSLRLRSHERFQLGSNAGRPLILVGNGTGIAGLRAHLKAAEGVKGARNWLVFGERNAAADFHYSGDIAGWLGDGTIERSDTLFSRDGEQLRYVQDQLAAQAPRLRQWVEQGAAIYVCGSLLTMAAGVHAVLANALGERELEALAESGRYRRDVY